MNRTRATSWTWLARMTRVAGVLAASYATAAEPTAQGSADSGHTLNFGVGGAAELELNGGQLQPGT